MVSTAALLILVCFVEVGGQRGIGLEGSTILLLLLVILGDLLLLELAEVHGLWR